MEAGRNRIRVRAGQRHQVRIRGVSRWHGSLAAVPILADLDQAIKLSKAGSRARQQG
jgi:hypothetical protein